MNLTEYGVLGVVLTGASGALAYLMKYILQRNDKDKEQWMQALKDTQDFHREQSQKDRDTYIESMSKIADSVTEVVIKVEAVEADVKKIDKTVNELAGRITDRINVPEM